MLTDDHRKYAFFDLDHTLLPQDTQFLMAQHILAKEPWRRIFILWLLPCALLYALKILSSRTMKRIYTSYQCGMSGQKLEKYAHQFVDEIFGELVYPDVIDEFNRLKAEGYTMILNSASPEFYLCKISEKLGFDHYLGSKFRLEEKMPFFPKIDGPNNVKAAKIAAMIDRGLIPEGYTPEENGLFPDSWAFSDSPADIPMLSLAENVVTIHPGPKLAEKAAEQNWATITPARPYSGRWGARIATARLAFGFGRKFIESKTRDL